MVLAYHVIFGAYGFWLPNDPRGSWSDFVASWELFRYGPATKTTARHSLARVAHDRAARLASKQALKYPAVEFTGLQALAVAHGFEKAIAESRYVIHACAILPEHVHLVIGRSERQITQIVGHLKGRATQQLTLESQWPEGHPVWAARCWKVFLNSEEDVRRAIEYVEQNPVKEGKRLQRWRFVVPFVEHREKIVESRELCRPRRASPTAK